MARFCTNVEILYKSLFFLESLATFGALATTEVSHLGVFNPFKLV